MNEIYGILSNIKPECDFKNSSNYVEDGLLDSFDLISLVTELEIKYDILIDALDIVPENFISAQTIAAMIEKNGGIV